MSAAIISPRSTLTAPDRPAVSLSISAGRAGAGLWMAAISFGAELGGLVGVQGSRFASAARSGGFKSAGSGSGSGGGGGRGYASSISRAATSSVKSPMMLSDWPDRSGAWTDVGWLAGSAAATSRRPRSVSAEDSAVSAARAEALNAGTSPSLRRSLPPPMRRGGRRWSARTARGAREGGRAPDFRAYGGPRERQDHPQQRSLYARPQGQERPAIGARLDRPTDIKLSESITVMVSDGTGRSAEVVWARMTRIGIRLLDVSGADLRLGLKRVLLERVEKTAEQFQQVRNDVRIPL